MRLAALVVLSLAPAAAAAEEPPREALAEADRAYRAAAAETGESRTALYREAARRYALIAARVESGRALFNLGNARYRSGELGRAIAAYRRAEVCLPRHAATRRNLQLARERAPGGGPGPQPHPAAAAFFFWHYALSLAEMEAAAAAFYLALMGVLSVRLFVDGRTGPARLWRARLRTAAIVLGALVFCAAMSSAAKLASRSRDEAVVVAGEARVRSEPAGRAVDLFPVREGAEVRILGRSGDWTRIEAGRDRRGWIETRALEVLSDPPHVGDEAAAGPAA